LPREGYSPELPDVVELDFQKPFTTPIFGPDSIRTRNISFMKQR